MSSKERQNPREWSFSVLLFPVPILLMLLCFATGARAQCGSAPNVDVYGTCNGNSPVQIGSLTRIDASVYCASQGCSGDDLCQMIADGLAQLPQAGGVVDARGVNSTSCTINPFSAGNTHPAIVLLPAPSPAITIEYTWTVPNQTRIVGQGRGRTVLNAIANQFSGPMIQMGVNCPSNICTGVSVSNLTLDGQSQSPNIDGIDNLAAGNLSYVDNVTINNIGGTALKIVGAANSGFADNSGPYTNLNINSDNNVNNLTNTSSCIVIEAQTKGIRSVTCHGGAVGNGPNPPGPYAGIYLDGSNNTIEDIHVESYQDGIAVGDSFPASNNTIANVTGAPSQAPLNNAVHVCGKNSSGNECCSGTNCSGTNQTTDLNLLDITAQNNTATWAILDDETGVHLGEAPSLNAENSIAAYILGEPFTVGTNSTAYSRFTTEKTVPTWDVGNQPLVGNPTATCTSPRSTILLPASSITINETWVLPAASRIIGEVPTPQAAGSTLVAASGFTPSDSYNTMIEMSAGSESIEHISLNASNLASVNGIVNSPPGLSASPNVGYVNDVRIDNLAGTGLVVGPLAVDSGPYTNLYFLASTSASCSTSACPICVQVQAQTRGVHGVTCIGSTNISEPASATPTHAAIYVQASNNSVEDVHVEGFYDGVQVETLLSGMAVGNVVVSNVTGANPGTKNGNAGPVTNTVHLCGPKGNQNGLGECQYTTAVSDVSIFQATDVDNGCGGSPGDLCESTAVLDDVTGTSIPTTFQYGGTTTGFYALGEAVGGQTTQFSRFSVSAIPNPQVTGSFSVLPVPSWGVGNAAPTGQTCYTPGALYSNTTATQGMQSVYVCTGASSGSTWQPIV